MLQISKDGSITLNHRFSEAKRTSDITKTSQLKNMGGGCSGKPDLPKKAIKQCNLRNLAGKQTEDACSA